MWILERAPAGTHPDVAYWEAWREFDSKKLLFEFLKKECPRVAYPDLFHLRNKDDGYYVYDFIRFKEEKPTRSRMEVIAAIQKRTEVLTCLSTAILDILWKKLQKTREDCLPAHLDTPLCKLHDELFNLIEIAENFRKLAQGYSKPRRRRKKRPKK